MNDYIFDEDASPASTFLGKGYPKLLANSLCAQQEGGLSVSRHLFSCSLFSSRYYVFVFLVLLEGLPGHTIVHKTYRCDALFPSPCLHLPLPQLSRVLLPHVYVWNLPIKGTNEQVPCGLTLEIGDLFSGHC